MIFERVSLDTKGFTNRNAAESWYPEKLKIYVYVKSAYINSREAIITVNKKNGRFSAKSEVTNPAGKNILKFDRFTTGRSYLELQKKGGFQKAGRAEYSCINDLYFNKEVPKSASSNIDLIKFQNEHSNAIVNFKTGTIIITSKTSHFKEMKRLMQYNPHTFKIGVLGFDDKPNSYNYQMDNYKIAPSERQIRIDGERLIIQMDPEKLREFVPVSKWHLVRLEENGTERYSWHLMWRVE